MDVTHNVFGSNPEAKEKSDARGGEEQEEEEEQRAGHNMLTYLESLDLIDLYEEENLPKVAKTYRDSFTSSCKRVVYTNGTVMVYREGKIIILFYNELVCHVFSVNDENKFVRIVDPDFLSKVCSLYSFRYSPVKAYLEIVPGDLTSVVFVRNDTGERFSLEISTEGKCFVQQLTFYK